jgi:hypothetical protein
MRKYWLIAVSIAAGLYLAASSPLAADEPWLDLTMAAETGKDWAFIGGDWKEDKDGTLNPPDAAPDKVVDENLAFYTAKAYVDFEAEFEFHMIHNSTGAGLAFRAQDARHYYMVHFPVTAMEFRGANFWAAISKVDESGYVQVLKQELVLGVPSELGQWQRVRVVVQGNEIRVWVNGRPGPVVHDDTYAGPGYVGLETYLSAGVGGVTRFRNLRIRGQEQQAPPWNPEIRPARNYFYPTREETYGPVQQFNSVARAPHGDLLMDMLSGSKFHGDQWTAVMIRSTDNGRTWSPMKEMFNVSGDSRDHIPAGMFSTSDGKLYMFKADYEKPKVALSRATSEDGVAWSEFEVSTTLDILGNQDQVWMYHAPVELMDGTFIWPGTARSPKSFGSVDGRYYENQRRHGAMNFVVRSTDRGQTWSSPINVDGPNPSPANVVYAKDNHPSEGSIGQAQDGRVVIFIRPITSPWMWESSSFDGGQTWTPLARGPFPQWASSTVCRSASGVLMIIGRHPGLGLSASWDNGMTWKIYRIDTTFWANGKIIEVEPDVMLFASTATYTDPHVRAHLIRVTPEGLEPIRVTAQNK